MRVLAVLVVLLIFGVLGTASAQIIENPQLASSSSLVINENGTVFVSGGAMKDVWIKIPIPISSPYQQVQADSAYKMDANGNPYVEIREDAPPNPFSYGRRIEVQTVARKTESLPQTFRLGKEEMQYLAATNKTQAKDPQIIALAANLTAGAEDDFEKVARLAIWVQNNVAYNESYLGRENGASEVLRQRQGVCYEYATLFTALARASGIPARYITGYVYSGRFAAWLGHAWAEVYLGNWVAVDPTWFEVGTADALHVESGKYLEMGREGNLVANIYPSGAQLDWETNGRSGALAANINTLDIGLGVPDDNFRLEAAAPKIAPGGTTLVFLEMEGNDYRVMPVSLASCTGNGALEVQGGTQYLIMRPGRNSTAVWKLNAPSDVSADYYYTCPLTLNSPYLAHRVVEVNVDPRAKKLPGFEAQLQNDIIPNGGQGAVVLNLPAERRGKKYFVVADAWVGTANVSAQRALLQFYAYGKGRKTAYVAGEGGGYLELGYGIAEPNNASVAIDSLVLPDEMVAGKPSKAYVRVSSANYPVKVGIEFYYGEQMTEQSGIIDKPADFQFEFVPASEGGLPITARLTAEGGSVEKNAFAAVEAQPEVKIATAASKKKGGSYETTIGLQMSGKPGEVWLDVDGQRQQASNGAAVFMLSDGAHNAKISWTDAAGNGYERNEVVNVGASALFGAVASRAQPASAGNCPLALAFVMLVPIVFISGRRKG